MDCPPQGSGALAVNDAYLQDSPLPAGSQVIGNEFFHFGRMKGMQIQCAINGEFHGVVHSNHLQIRINLAFCKEPLNFIEK
jgi:hypothetical protein